MCGGWLPVSDLWLSWPICSRKWLGFDGSSSSLLQLTQSGWMVAGPYCWAHSFPSTGRSYSKQYLLWHLLCCANDALTMRMFLFWELNRVWALLLVCLWSAFGNEDLQQRLAVTR